MDLDTILEIYINDNVFDTGDGVIPTKVWVQIAMLAGIIQREACRILYERKQLIVYVVGDADPHHKYKPPKWMQELEQRRRSAGKLGQAMQEIEHTCHPEAR